VRVHSVTFFQLAVLDAEDDARVTRGAGRSGGIWICGLALRKRWDGGGNGGVALTTESRCFGAGGTLSRSFRARTRSSRSFLEAGYAGWPIVFLVCVFGLEIGPVQSVVTVGLIVAICSL
jgi:hypothetical protein